MGSAARAALVASLVERLGSSGVGAFVGIGLRGERGVGKTTVLEAVARELSDRGVTVLWASADPSETMRPFGVLGRLLPVAMSSLAVDDEGRPVDGLTYRAIDAALAQFEELSSRAACVLIVDDAQWIDELSRRALVALAREGGSQRVGLLLAATVDDGDLQRLVGAIHGMVFEVVDPLDDHQVAVVATEILGRPPGPRLTAALMKAGGNAYFVSALLADFEHDDLLRSNGETIDVERVPKSIGGDAVRHRLAHLPRETEDLLRIAAVIGRRFRLEILATLANLDAIDVIGFLRPAIRLALLVERDGELGFAHDLVHECLYSATPTPFRRLLHRQIADVMLSIGDDATLVSHHLLQATSEHDRAAVDVLRSAAHRVGVQSTSSAVALLRRAVDAYPAGERGRDRLVAELVSALVAAGSNVEAERRARGVIDRGADAMAEALARGALVTAALAAGDIEAAAEQSELAAGVGALEAFSLAAASRYHLIAGRIERARDLISRAEAAVAPEDRLAACQVAEAQSDLAVAEGRLADALEHARRAVNIGDALDSFFGAWVRPEVQLASVLIAVDRYDDARDRLRRAAAECEAAGLMRWAVRSHELAAMADVFSGSWPDARVSLEVAASIGADVGVAVSGDHAALTALLAIESGDAIGQERAARRHPLTSALRLDAETLEALWTQHERSPLSRHWMRQRIAAPTLVELLVAADRTEDARAVAERSIDAARLAPDVGTADMAATWCEGVLRGDADMVAAAGESVEATAPWLSARAAEAAARLRVASGDQAGARRLLRGAWSTYKRLGADAKTQAVGGAIRDLGGRAPAQPREATSRSGWESLTPAERRVVALVVAGLTNKEIGERLYVSRRTVATHLERIFPKLGLSSRIDLATEATRRGYESVM